MIHVANLEGGPVCATCAATYRANPVGEVLTDVPAEWLDAWGNQPITPVRDVGAEAAVGLDPCVGCGTRALGSRRQLRIRLTVPACPDSFHAPDARRVLVGVDGAVTFAPLEENP